MAAEQPGASESVASADLAGLAVLDRYFSVPLIFSLLAAAAFAIAWNRGIAFMHAVFAMLAMAAAFTALAPAWMVRPARLRFTLPREGRVGEAIAVEAALEPLSWPRRRRMVRIDAPFPFAPSRALFLAVAGAGLVHATRVTLRRRGVFTLHRTAVASGYPIGMRTVRRSWQVEPVSITVFPRLHAVRRFPAAAASARVQGEVERPAASVGQELLREVREYRSGDNPRHIHWRSSAHHGRLIVKQFETIATSESWILLDLDPAVHAGRGEHHSLELAIELAASLAAHLARSGVRCGLAGGLRDDGTFALWCPPAAGSTHAQSLLYALTAIEAQPCAPYGQMLSVMARQRERGQQWVLFDHGPRGLAVPAEGRGDCLWFRFDNSSFEDEQRAAGALQPPARLADGFSIAVDTDLAEVFR